jgi:hypothetical protein
MRAHRRPLVMEGSTSRPRFRKSVVDAWMQHTTPRLIRIRRRQIAAGAL